MTIALGESKLFQLQFSSGKIKHHNKSFIHFSTIKHSGYVTFVDGINACDSHISTDFSGTQMWYLLPA